MNTWITMQAATFVDLHLIVVLIDGEIGAAYIFQTEALAREKIEELSEEYTSRFHKLSGLTEASRSSNARLKIRHLALPVHLEGSL